MTDTSSADPLAASGASSKSTEELKKLIEETVRSMKVANEPRPPEVAQAPVAKINIGWTGVGALAAVVGLMFGAFFWLNDSISSAIRAESESIRAEFRAENESIRAEIRAETKASALKSGAFVLRSVTFATTCARTSKVSVRKSAT